LLNVQLNTLHLPVVQQAPTTDFCVVEATGLTRCASRAPSGTSNVIVAILPAVTNQDTAAAAGERNAWVCTLERGASEAPREVLPIVSRFSAGRLKVGCGGTQPPLSAALAARGLTALLHGARLEDEAVNSKWPATYLP
jgi:hypothetical protein